MERTDPSRVYALARSALSKGGVQVSHTLTLAQAASQCEAPRRLAYSHRQTATPFRLLHGREVAYGVPCRKCESCRRARAALWYRRISQELDCHATSYLVTLTIRPDNRYQLDADAFGIKDRGDGPEAFRRRALYLVPEIQRYVKRIRENARPTRLRYVYVIEPHKDWYPHVHILWHCPADSPLELNGRGYPSVFETQWLWGFTSAKGAVIHNYRAASYCAKYLTKEASASVRASVRYGRTLLPTEQQVRDKIVSTPSKPFGGQMTTNPVTDLALAVADRMERQ